MSTFVSSAEVQAEKCTAPPCLQGALPEGIMLVQPRMQRSHQAVAGGHVR